MQGLQGMGIKDAFDPKVADFSKISDDRLFLTSVLQSVSSQGLHRAQSLGCACNRSSSSYSAAVTAASAALSRHTPDLEWR